MYFLIIFLSPVYFFIRNKWAAFAMNLVLYGLAWLTIWIFGIGMIFWALGVGHAMFAYRREERLEQAKMIAEAIARERK